MEAWESQAPASHYSFSIDYQCHCRTRQAKRTYFLVANGDDVSLAWSRDPMNGEFQNDGFEGMPSVSGIFKIIAQAIETESLVQSPEYSKSDGFPYFLAYWDMDISPEPIGMWSGDLYSPDDYIAETKAAKEAWMAQEIHNYEFILDRNCFLCGNDFPLYIRVIDDQVAELQNYETGLAINPEEVPNSPFPMTMEALFDTAISFAGILSADVGIQIAEEGYVKSASHSTFHGYTDLHLSYRVIDFTPLD